MNESEERTSRVNHTHTSGILALSIPFKSSHGWNVNMYVWRSGSEDRVKDRVNETELGGLGEWTGE